MKKVLLVLPLAIMLANCNTPRSSTGSSGTNGSTGSTSGTNMSTGTSGSGSASSSGSMGTNNSSGMQSSGSMAGNVYDPNNYMQNPEKYKRPYDLRKTGGWTYLTDWRVNTNFTPEAEGQWRLVPTSEVASNWVKDTSRPETFPSYWTEEAVMARQQAKMAEFAAAAMNDSMMNASSASATEGGNTSTTSGRTSASGSMSGSSRGNNRTNRNTGSGSMSGTAGMSGTMSGSAGTSGTMSGTTGTETSGTMSGTAGTSGTSGTMSGTAGTSGTSGTMSGTAGTSGTSGTMSGTAGTSGTSGSMSGSAGTSGTSGTMSGTAGTSGMTGSGTMGGTTGSGMSGENFSGTLSAINAGVDSGLVAVNGNRFMMPKINMYIGNGSFTGYTGCNNIVGTMKAEGGQLSFQDAVPVANLQCIGGFDQSAYTDRLKRADSYEVVNNQLRLKQGGTVLMVFDKNTQ